MTKPPSVHTGEITMTNERGLRGPGFDTGDRSGPPPEFPFPTGTLGLAPQGPDRKLDFDLSIVRTDKAAWFFFLADLKDFFRFTVRNFETGEVESEGVYPMKFPEGTFLREMIYQASKGIVSALYPLPAAAEKVGPGKHTLTIEVNPEFMVCAPVRFYFEVDGENIWMFQPPERAIEWKTFEEGAKA
jgi:hypothetical protein